MAILVIVLVIAGIAVLWWRLDIPPAGMDTLIVIQGTGVSIKRGHFRPPVLADVRALVSDARIGKGWIGITHRRVAFSRSIPMGLRQKLRNVILNG
jgi:hypothetical protein